MLLNTYDLSTVEGAVSFATMAHAGQRDKAGAPYCLHVIRVGASLHRFGPDYVIAGTLHDILEDTEWTSADLLDLGASADVVRAVESVTKTESERSVEAYRKSVARAMKDPIGLWVKAADVSDNASRLDQVLHGPVQAGLRDKYVMAAALLQTRISGYRIGGQWRPVGAFD